MLYFEIATEIVMLCAFFYGAINLWRKGKPLYFQIIICAIGCVALYQLSVIVMTFCDVNETYFNNSFFGYLGCNFFMFCANRGALEKMFDKPKTGYIVISALAGVAMFALTIFVDFLYFGAARAVFFLYIVMQIPACFVVYYNVKHLFTPKDDLGLIKGIRMTDVFTLAFNVFSVIDLIFWIDYSILSGVADLLLSFLVMGLSISAVRGAKKWNF